MIQVIKNTCVVLAAIAVTGLAVAIIINLLPVLFG